MGVIKAVLDLRLILEVLQVLGFEALGYKRISVRREADVKYRPMGAMKTNCAAVGVRSFVGIKLLKEESDKSYVG